MPRWGNGLQAAIDGYWLRLQAATDGLATAAKRAKTPTSIGLRAATVACGAWFLVCTVLGIFIVGSCVSATSTAAALRLWAMYGSPESAVIPFSFDFSSASSSGGSPSTAAATTVVATLVPYTAPVSDGSESKCSGAADDEPQCWGRHGVHQSQAMTKLGFAARSSVSLTVLLELPDDMQAAGMITVAADIFGRDTEGLEHRVARGAGSAAMRRRSYIIHVVRSAIMWLPRIALGYEVNSQTLEIPLIRGFEAKSHLAARLSTVNITLSASAIQLRELVVYDARLALDVELTGWLTSWFQRYPLLSFAACSCLFFSLYFSMGLACCGLVVAGCATVVDVPLLVKQFVLWEFGGDEPTSQAPPRTQLPRRREPPEQPSVPAAPPQVTRGHESDQGHAQRLNLRGHQGNHLRPPAEASSTAAARHSHPGSSHRHASVDSMAPSDSSNRSCATTATTATSSAGGEGSRQRRGGRSPPNGASTPATAPASAGGGHHALPPVTVAVHPTGTGAAAVAAPTPRDAAHVEPTPRGGDRLATSREPSAAVEHPAIAAPARPTAARKKGKGIAATVLPKGDAPPPPPPSGTGDGGESAAA